MIRLLFKEETQPHTLASFLKCPKEFKLPKSEIKTKVLDIKEK
jgi:hypothetical protein